MLLGTFPNAWEVESRIAAADAFDRVDIVGSFRRRCPTVGDIDILATVTDTGDAMALFCTDEDVTEVLARGDRKASVLASGDLQMDLRIVDDDECWAALVYSTGSKAHNISLRNRAIDRDWKLNE
jgi:DNA polymerase (family 10)